MSEPQTYRKVAIPMTEEQACKTFACEICTGFTEAYEYLMGFTDLVKTYPEMDAAYHKSLDLVAHRGCDGECWEGATMSIVCPCCNDRVYFDYSCFLPTEIECMHCGADLVSGDHEAQLAIRRIIKDHNAMRMQYK